MKTGLVSLAAIAAALCTPALAGDAWDEIRPDLYGERVIQSVDGVLSLKAPYRASDDAEVPIEVSVDLPDGRSIKALSIIIDNNPMPVSAVFDLEKDRTAFTVEANMRINGPTPVRAVVEATDGSLYMTEGFVKTSGQGACAAPPVTGVDAALASLGEMKVFPVTAEAGAGTATMLASLTGTPTTAPTQSSIAAEKRVRLEMKHPSHSGMQMDQITLLYILARYVETVEVWTDEDKLFTMTGSISLSEDPEMEFTLADPAIKSIRVRMTDTDDTVSEDSFSLGES
jgi:sulfur-oxidizing protein SoxY